MGACQMGVHAQLQRERALLQAALPHPPCAVPPSADPWLQPNMLPFLKAVADAPHGSGALRRAFEHALALLAVIAQEDGTLSQAEGAMLAQELCDNLADEAQAAPVRLQARVYPGEGSAPRHP